MNTRINPRAAHVTATVAFAPNGKQLSEAFDWITVEAEADIHSIFGAARQKAIKFMSHTQADSATLFIIEVRQQWDADGKLI